jgi:ABC-type branched-subunit amino acid transport system ATPase component
MVEDFSVETVEVRGFPIQTFKHRFKNVWEMFAIKRMLRDNRGWPLAGGTVQMQRISIAGAMMGRRFNER